MPAGGDGAIRFSAGPALTVQEAPATKFGAMKEGFTTAGETVRVYTRRNTDGSPVFNGDAVTWDGSAWSYDNIRYWNWTSSSDYYDFLAVYQPAGMAISPTFDNAAIPLRLSASYNAAAAQYDLMLAGTRRKYEDENHLSPVSLEFRHMLSAVTFKLTNLSNATQVRLDGYHFENIVTQGTASVSADYDSEGNPAFAWSETSRQATPTGGSVSASAAELSGRIPWTVGTNRTKTVDLYDLMIPQSHEGKIGADGYPVLVVDYTPIGFSPGHAEILLKDIPVTGGTTPITGWEAGTKYCYEINIDPDAGAKVRVIVMPWDDVQAETPGLLLPPDLTL